MLDKAATLQKLTNDLDALWTVYTNSPDIEQNLHGMEFLAHLCQYGYEVCFNSRAAAPDVTTLRTILQASMNFQATKEVVQMLTPATTSPVNIFPLKQGDS